MIAATISEFRKDLKTYLDDVSDNTETLIIHRGKQNGVVVISLNEYNAMNATLHEMSSKKNMQRLDASLEKTKLKKTFKKQLIDK